LKLATAPSTVSALVRTEGARSVFDRSIRIHAAKAR
jgi:hypothetical protein